MMFHLGSFVGQTLPIKPASIRTNNHQPGWLGQSKTDNLMMTAITVRRETPKPSSGVSPNRPTDPRRGISLCIESVRQPDRSVR